MDHNISNPLPADAAVRAPLPQHTVELTPPRGVKRKGSVADMLMRLTTHTASSRGKARDAPSPRAAPRSVSSPQRVLRPSQSMRSLRPAAAAASSPPVGRRAHTRTRSNPAAMPPISRPIALPVGFSQAPARGAAAAARTPAVRQRRSFSSSLLSDSSGASSRSAESPDPNASKVSLGTPRRPAPLPPSQATAAQPRARRGPGALASPPQNPASRKPAPPKPGATTPLVPSAPSAPPTPVIEPLAVAKTRRTPQRAARGAAKPAPEYVKRSPRARDAGDARPVGLGLDLGAPAGHKRVASAPAPPAGYTATKPRAMSHIMPPQPAPAQADAAHSPPERRAEAPRTQSPRTQSPRQAQASNQRQTSPAGQAPSPREHQQQWQPQSQAQAQAQPQRQARFAPQPPAQPPAQSPRAVSRSQQMRDRLAELQSMTRQGAAARPADPRTPVMQQTGFGESPGPARASPSAPTPSHEPQDVLALKQKLSRLEARYNVLKEQREQDALNLQFVSGELNTVQASRDSLLQQVSAYEHAQQEMQRRLDSLQKNLTRSQRLLRVLGANLEDSKVALEEKNMENYALKRCLSRAARPKLHGAGDGVHNDGGMLSPPSSISDAADVEQDSDTPTLRA